MDDPKQGHLQLHVPKNKYPTSKPASNSKHAESQATSALNESFRDKAEVKKKVLSLSHGPHLYVQHEKPIKEESSLSYLWG